MSNGYVYPSAYTYNGGISYPYNIDQNTKEQMEAYNKLMLASYQNGQQFYSNSQYPSLSPTQQQVFTGTMNSSANTQNTEDTRSTIEGGNDNSKKHEEAMANPHNSSFSVEVLYQTRAYNDQSIYKKNFSKKFFKKQIVLATAPKI